MDLSGKSAGLLMRGGWNGRWFPIHSTRKPMNRRTFFNKSMTGGIALGGAASLRHPLAAQVATPHSDLPSKFTPSAYSVPSTKYSPFTTPDYYTYADNL